MDESNQQILIPIEMESMLCPGCLYDLRGAVEPVCPECGRGFTVAQVHAYARRRQQFDRLYRRLPLVPLAWFALYVVSGEIFSGTADRVSNFWIKLVFLNIPLQLGLGVLGYYGVRAQRKGIQNVARALLVISLILILGHCLISLFTL